MWKLIIAATVGGLIVVVILMVASCLRAKRRTEKQLHKRKQTNITDLSVSMNMIDNAEVLPADKDGVYSVIPCVPVADCPTGPAKSVPGKPQTADSDVYHMYCTIPDLRSPAKDDRMYEH